MNKTLNWLLVLVGIWLIIAPWVLNFSDNPGAMWNSIIFGVIVGVINLVGALGGGKKEKEEPTV